jgi:hypothetical protein
MRMATAKMPQPRRSGGGPAPRENPIPQPGRRSALTIAPETGAVKPGDALRRARRSGNVGG